MVRRRRRYQLGEQIRRRGLSVKRQAGINRCIDDLVAQHRVALCDLMVKDIIPGSTSGVYCRMCHGPARCAA